jgi:hypothetical protein
MLWAMYNSAMVRDTILAARQTRTRKVQTAQHVASAVEATSIGAAAAGSLGGRWAVGRPKTAAGAVRTFSNESNLLFTFVVCVVTRAIKAVMLAAIDVNCAFFASCICPNCAVTLNSVSPRSPRSFDLLLCVDMAANVQ